MDYQDSARVEEAAIKRPCQRVRNPFVETGDHRIAGWSEQAASQDPGITRITSKKARFPIEEAFRPPAKQGTSPDLSGNPTNQASGITSELRATRELSPDMTTNEI